MVKKEAGVRKIWQPRVLKLDGSRLSWAKQQADTVERGSITLSSKWRVDTDIERGGQVFVLRSVNDQQNRFFFDAGTSEDRQGWLDAIQSAINVASAEHPTKRDASPSPSPKANGASKGGRFMKGVRDRVQVAALLAAGVEGDSDVQDDDDDLLIAIGCRARCGQLIKESTGASHKMEERFFTLTANAQLQYHKTREDAVSGKAPQGRIPLGPRWQVAATWREKHPHAIKVWDPTCGAAVAERGGVYYMVASDEDEQHCWVDDIMSAILSLRFGEMSPDELLLQRAMMRVYKTQKDAHYLPYQPMALAELGLIELCYSRAHEGLSGFIDQ